jgi:hypothetical protein
MVGHDVDATPFLVSNRGRHLCYYFCSRCSPASVCHGCHRGHCLHSLLLPYLLCPNLQNDFGVPSAALIVNQSGANPLGRRHVLASDDDSSGFGLMRWSMVLGLHCPNSSLKSRRMRPSRKASMSLSGEMFSDVLCRLSHRDMYDLRLSPVFCTHKRISSNDKGHREVPRKFAMKACQNSSQERMPSGARLLSHALALSFRCNDSN